MTARRPTLTLAYLKHAPASAAQVLERLTSESAAAFLDDVPARLAATVVAEMSPWHGSRALSLMPLARAAAVLQQLPFHDSVGLLRLMPSGLHAKLFDEFPARRASRLKSALRYPVGSVGAWLDPDIPAFPESATVADALAYIRHSEEDNHVFLQADASGDFLGALPVGRLLRNDPEMRLGDLPHEKLMPLSSRASLTSASANADWQRYLVLPVIGRGRAMVGGLARASLSRGLNERQARTTDAAPSIPLQVLSMLGIVCAGLLKALTAGGGRSKESSHG